MVFRLGRHINISSGFTTAPEYGHSLGCNFIQIFLGSPQRIISKMRSENELKTLGKELDKYKMKMVIHGSYTINLCHPHGNSIFKSSVKSLVQDLDSSVIIGSRCIGVIIHMGKNIKSNGISDDEAIDNYINGIKQALEQSNGGTIILETGASQGTEVGSKINGLVAIYDGLTKEEKKRVMFCIDTCHIWATGYNISDIKGVMKFFNRFDRYIGIDKISCIHFNDSKTAVNSCVDRHADLGYGFIGVEGLKRVAKFAYDNNIPLLMETPLNAVNSKTGKTIDTPDEIKKVKKWILSDT